MPDASFIRLPLLTQTAYARLLDLLLTAEAGDPVSGATLVSKTIVGRRYWYAQRREAGKKIQTYIGPETAEVTALIERWRRSRADANTRTELIAMARAGGAYLLRAPEAEVLARLAPVFRVGGVLVGSHAFAVLGNMLGVRWQDAMVRTEDVDIAHDHRIAVALARDAEPVNIPQALGDVAPRFSVLSPTAPATSFRVRGTQVEVEILTPLVGRERNRPIHIDAVGAAATPLRFLDYLIEETQPGAVLGGSGVLVNVPRPGRFALHKLIVASRRSQGASGATKAPKDRAQASALLRVLLADLPGEITLAWKELSKRGKAWVTAAATSLARLDGDLIAQLGRAGVRVATHR
jgi:hypothetical protein